MSRLRFGIRTIIYKQFSTEEEMLKWWQNPDNLKEIEIKYPAEEFWICQLNRKVLRVEVLRDADKFLADCEGRCPYCDSGDIDSYDDQTDDNRCEKYMECNTCEKKFVEVYTIEYQHTEKREWG